MWYTNIRTIYIPTYFERTSTSCIIRIIVNIAWWINNKCFSIRIRYISESSWTWLCPIWCCCYILICIIHITICNTHYTHIITIKTNLWYNKICIIYIPTYFERTSTSCIIRIIVNIAWWINNKCFSIRIRYISESSWTWLCPIWCCCYILICIIHITIWCNTHYTHIITIKTNFCYKKICTIYSPTYFSRSRARCIIRIIVNIACWINNKCLSIRIRYISESSWPW